VLAEFVSKIQALAQTALAPTTIPLPDGSTLLRKGDNYEYLDFVPAKRKYALNSLLDVVNIANDHANSAVFVNPGAITVLLDEEDRRETATMKLDASPTYLALEVLGKTDAVWQPKDLVRFLRFKLRGIDTDTINKFRKIDFTLIETGKTEEQHGRHTLGRSIEAQVQGADKIPEDLTINLNVFSNSGLDAFIETVTLGVLLDTHSNPKGVVLKPLAGELEDAVLRTLASIVKRLDEQLVNISPILGSPS
jgi:hypothetical protein